MAFYHISPKTGNPAKCAGPDRCRFGGPDAGMPHFGDQQEARDFTESLARIEADIDTQLDGTPDGGESIMRTIAMASHYASGYGGNPHGYADLSGEAAGAKRSIALGEHEKAAGQLEAMGRVLDKKAATWGKAGNGERAEDYRRLAAEAQKGASTLRELAAGRKRTTEGIPERISTPEEVKAAAKVVADAGRDAAMSDAATRHPLNIIMARNLIAKARKTGDHEALADAAGMIRFVSRKARAESERAGEMSAHTERLDDIITKIRAEHPHP